MKKILTVFILLALVVSFSGCKKRDQGMAGMLPENTILKLQIWTAQEPEFVEALAREFVSRSRTPGLQTYVISFDSDEELQRYALEKMAEGLGPDILFTEGDWIAKNTKKLVPLEQDEAYSVGNFRKTFVHAAAESMISGGNIYGMPMAVDTLGIFYNEEHLIDRLNNRNTPAPTWYEFKEDTADLTKTDNSLDRFAVSGAAMGRADNINYGVDILENLMLQLGVTFFDAEQGTARFASSSGVMSDGKKTNLGEEALRYYTSFADPRYKHFSWNEDIVAPTAEGRDFLPFLRGETSMVFGYTRDLDRMKSLAKEMGKGDLNALIAEENIRVGFLPQFEDPEKSHTRSVIGKVWAFAVPRGAQQSAISWAFLKFAGKKDNAVSFHEVSQLPTARLDLISEQADAPDIGIFVRQAKFAKPNFLPLDRAQFESEFADLITQINVGKTTIEKGLSTLETDLTQRVLKQQNREKKIQSLRAPSSSASDAVEE